MKVLADFGTRFEAIRMAQLVYALAAKKLFDSKVCVTAQGREMLEPVLESFDITTDHEFNAVKGAKVSPQLTSRISFVDIKEIW